MMAVRSLRAERAAAGTVRQRCTYSSPRAAAAKNSALASSRSTAETRAADADPGPGARSAGPGAG